MGTWDEADEGFDQTPTADLVQLQCLRDGAGRQAHMQACGWLRVPWSLACMWGHSCFLCSRWPRVGPGTRRVHTCWPHQLYDGRSWKAATEVIVQSLSKHLHGRLTRDLLKLHSYAEVWPECDAALLNKMTMLAARVSVVAHRADSTAQVGPRLHLETCAEAARAVRCCRLHGCHLLRDCSDTLQLAPAGLLPCEQPISSPCTAWARPWS